MCSALIVRRCTLFLAKCDFLGIGSEEWAAHSVTVTALPFLTADAALPQTRLCPLPGPRTCRVPMGSHTADVLALGAGMAPAAAFRPAPFSMGRRERALLQPMGGEGALAEYQLCTLCTVPNYLMAYFITSSHGGIM